MAQGDADKPYKAQIKPATHRAIRHLPFVVAHIKAIAEKGARTGGDNWGVLVQNQAGTKRPRAYILPLNAKAEAQDGQENTMFKIISSLRGS